jgi:hypothetical protein
MSSRAAEIVDKLKSLDEAEVRSVVNEANRLLEERQIPTPDRKKSPSKVLEDMRKGLCDYVVAWTREELYYRDSR